MSGFDAVLVIAFGGPTRPEEIRPFLANVTRGRPIPPDRLEIVAHHYEQIGGASPLNQLTFRQARALEAELKRRGAALPVYVGMRNWDPFLRDTLARMWREGSRRAVGLILSPQQSEAGWDRYVANVQEALQELQGEAPQIAIADGWFDHPLFVRAVVDLARTALAEVPQARRASTHVVFTAHSIPVTAAARSAYVQQVLGTAGAAARELGGLPWSVAYQSRSGSPREPWLEPDIGLALRSLAADGVKQAVVVPIGFVCDHVEVLYDLDIEASAIAREAGIGFTRVATVNDHPAFIEMLAQLVEGMRSGSERTNLGTTRR